MKLDELLNLQAGDLILGLNSVIGPQSSYLTLNETGWDDTIVSPPPVCYIFDSFIDKCSLVELTNHKNLNNKHLLGNYLAVSTRTIRGNLDYLCIPGIENGDLIGMSLGETI